jgi:protein-S-isoprenylcysteine O-methyltransferase Ste14
MTDPDPRRFPFPPAIPVIALLASWGLGQVWPIQAAWPNWTFWAGLVLFTVPHVLGIWEHRTFRRHHATVNPLGDVVEIMTDGPFRYTRNPMYLSLLPLYVGAHSYSAYLGRGYCCSQYFLFCISASSFRKRNTLRQNLARHICATSNVCAVGYRCALGKRVQLASSWRQRK